MPRIPRRTPNPREIQEVLFNKSATFQSHGRNILFQHGIRGADADDMLIEAREKYARFANPSAHRKRQAGYFFRILSNRIIDWLRKNGKKPRGSEKPIQVSTELIEKMQDHFKVPEYKGQPYSFIDEWIELVKSEVKKQQVYKKKLNLGLAFDTFYLRFIKGLSNKEVAAMQGISTATVRWRLLKFREFLKESGLSKQLNH